MVWNTSSGLTLRIFNLIVTIPSLFGSSAMIYFTLKAITTESQKICNKIILCIAMSDFILTTANILSLFQPPTQVSTSCIIEGLLRVWSYLPTLWFVASLSILCLRKNNVDHQSRFLCYMLTFTFLSCLALSLLPFLIPQYLYFTNGPIICYISSDPGDSIFLKLLFRTLYEGLTTVFVFFITLIAYAITVRRVRRELNTNIDFNLYKVFWYPFVMLLVTVPSLIDDYNQISHPNSSESLLLMHILLTHSIGTFNAIVYGWQRNLFRIKRRGPREVEVHSPGDPNYLTSPNQELLRASRLA